MVQAPQSPVVLLLSTSDTDLITARASGAQYRWANPSRLVDGELEDLLNGADLAVVRILGGYRAWEDGIDAVVASGVPDGRGQRRAGARRRADGTLDHPAGRGAGGAHLPGAGRGGESRQLHAFLCDTVLMTGFGFAPPVSHADLGCARAAHAGDGDGPTIAVLYYRAQHLAGNTAYVEALCHAIEAPGGTALPVFCASLRTAEPELLELLGTADAMVVTVLAAGGAMPADASAPVATTTPGTSRILPHWTCRSCRACA